MCGPSGESHMRHSVHRPYCILRSTCPPFVWDVVCPLFATMQTSLLLLLLFLLQSSCPFGDFMPGAVRDVQRKSPYGLAAPT